MSSKTTSLTTHDAWLLTHAEALVRYTKHDARFGHELASAIRHTGWLPDGQVAKPIASPYLTPSESRHAIQLATWLLAAAEEASANVTRGVLAAWALEREIPKNFIVMGLGGTMIPGLTVGDPSIKRKKRAQLALIVERTWYQARSLQEQVSLSVDLAQQVIAAELRYARGNAFALHPDTAEWCLSDPQTKLYQEDPATLRTIASLAEQHELVFRTIRSGTGQPIAIALSPSVNQDLTEAHCTDLASLDD